MGKAVVEGGGEGREAGEKAGMMEVVWRRVEREAESGGGLKAFLVRSQRPPYAKGEAITNQFRFRRLNLRNKGEITSKYNKVALQKKS